MLADKYDLTLTARYDYSVYGFAVRVLKPEVLAALRCEPAIKHVSYNQSVHVTQSRSWPPNNSLQADKGKWSRRLRAHTARQLAFAADVGRPRS